MNTLGITFLGYTFGVIWFVLFVFLWLLLAFLPANIASHKGRSFWGYFLLSLFFWWITLFVVLLMPNKTPSASTPSDTNTPATS